MNQAGDTAMTVDTARPLTLEPAPLKARPKGPAKPILKGVGLDAPFFSDKNRAFWVLQSIGWGGYFILRSLSGRGASLYAGDVACAIVGRVSMDLITVDVTGLDQVPDRLDLICAHQPIDRLAEIAGTIGYEVLTSLGSRYDRTYR